MTMHFDCESNEVHQYLDAQYVSAFEVAWQLFVRICMKKALI